MPPPGISEVIAQTKSCHTCLFGQLFKPDPIKTELSLFDFYKATMRELKKVCSKHFQMKICDAFHNQKSNCFPVQYCLACTQTSIPELYSK